MEIRFDERFIGTWIQYEEGPYHYARVDYDLSLEEWVESTRDMGHTESVIIAQHAWVSNGWVTIKGCPAEFIYRMFQKLASIREERAHLIGHA